jgi:hypothetical protein
MPGSQNLQGSDKLKKLAESLKQRNEMLFDENNELGKIIQSFRDGNYNVSEGAKMVNDEQVSNLRSQL